MKVEWNKKYNTIAIYAVIVLVISAALFLGMSKLGTVKLQINEYLSPLTPILIGAVMAYLFNFILEIYEEKVVKRFVPNETKKGKSSKNIVRAIGMVLTYLTIILVFILFLNFVLPQLVNSIKGLVNNIPVYVKDIGILISKAEERFDMPAEYMDLIMDKWNDAMDFTIGFATALIPKIGNMARGMVSSIWNIVLGLIVSIYLLLEKERFQAISKKITTSIFSEKNTEIVFELVNRADRIFGSFLSGKILDSAIIGVLTFIVLTLFAMPYTMLISFIIGITNIIPFFGPFIGAVPAFFIIFFESPVKAFTFLIIIVIIQQIDGNIIGPKILGDSLGISAFWILFSLLVAGKLLGFIGLVVGVPLFVFIYSIIKDLVEARLKKKGLPYETEEYM